MNRDRLLHLIAVLEEVEKHEKPFSMRVWKATVKELKREGVPVLGRECGTASCALGYAARDRVFKKQGLELDPFREDAPRFGHLTGFSAAQLFFGIEPIASRHLFDPAAYPTLDRTGPRQVIERIQEMLARSSKRSATAASRITTTPPSAATATSPTSRVATPTCRSPSPAERTGSGGTL